MKQWRNLKDIINNDILNSQIRTVDKNINMLIISSSHLKQRNLITTDSGEHFMLDEAI